MADRARFDILIRGSATGVNRAVGSLKSLETALRGVQRQQRSSMRTSLRGFGRTGVAKEVGFLDRAFASLTSRFRFTDIGLGALASSAANVAATFGRITYAAGEAYMNVARFQEDSVTALTTVMGSQRGAREAFSRAMVVAQETPLSQREVIGNWQALTVGGFRGPEVETHTRAAADLSAANGRVAGDAYIRVLRQMRSLNRVTTGDITEQATTAGLNAGHIYDSIARQMGLANRAAAVDAVKHGRVLGDAGIRGFQEAVSRGYNGGRAVGTFSRRASRTVTGQLSNLREAPEVLLSSVNLSGTAGMRSFIGAVGALNGVLSATSETGRRLRDVMIGTGDAVLSGLFGGVDQASLSGVLNDALDLAEGVVGVIRVGAPLVRSFFGGALAGFRSGFRPVIVAMGTLGGAKNGESLRLLGVMFRYAGRAAGFFVGAFGTVLAVAASFTGLISAVVGGITTLPGAIVGFLEEGGSALWDFGYGGAMSIVEGFELGITETGDRISGAVTGAFDRAVGAARNVLDWHSPSGVFRDAGADVARGFELGVSGGASAAADAVAALVRPRDLAGPSPRASNDGRPVAHITINVPPHPDAQAIVRGVMDELVGAFEVIALQGATDG